jgi:hypothetical protein
MKDKQIKQNCTCDCHTQRDVEYCVSCDKNHINTNWEKAKTIDADKTLVIKTKSGKDIVIDRGGVNNKRLAEIIASSTTTEQEEVAIANWLIETGRDNSGFLAEMFRMRGIQTHEMREFKSQMRFDFEMFVATYTTFLRDTADRVWDSMGYTSTISEVIKDYNKDPKTLKGKPIELIAISFYDQADHLEKTVKKITEQRERNKGKGIYVDKLGITHSLHDEDIIDIIRHEKEELSKQKKDAKDE